MKKMRKPPSIYLQLQEKKTSMFMNRQKTRVLLQTMQISPLKYKV